MIFYCPVCKSEFNTPHHHNGTDAIRMMDVELHEDKSEPCFVCETSTHAFVPEFGAWLCFRCFRTLTSVVVIADRIMDEVKSKMDEVDKMYNRHDNN